MIDYQYGLFVWDDGDDLGEQRTMLKEVRWTCAASGDAPRPDDRLTSCNKDTAMIVRYALQARFHLGVSLAAQLERGADSLGASRYRSVALPITSLAQFNLTFAAALARRVAVHVANSKPMATYEGPYTVVTKVHVSYVWRTLREWVVFITGLDGWVARHKLRNQLCVVIPNAALATGCSFGPGDPN